MNIFFGIISSIIWPLVIIGWIVFFIRRKHRKSHHAQKQGQDKNMISQMFLLLSFFFLGVTLFAFNRDFGDPLAWRTVLFISSIIGLVGTYYLKTIYTLTFSLVGLASWWGVQAFQWIDIKDIKTSALFTGLTFIALLFYSIGHLHKKQIKFKRFASVYLALGLITVTGTLFLFSTKLGIFMIGEMTRGTSFFGSWQLTFSLFLFLLL